MFKIFTIPFNRFQKGFDHGALANFSLNKEILFYQAQFFTDGSEKYWTVFLEYDPLVEKAPEKDTERLDEPQKILLERLRTWRKERAERDGVPVYIIGTNKEFLQIAVSAPRSLEALKEIKGFGKAKMAKYGKEIINIINGYYTKS